MGRRDDRNRACRRYEKWDIERVGWETLGKPGVQRNARLTGTRTKSSVCSVVKALTTHPWKEEKDRTRLLALALTLTPALVLALDQVRFTSCYQIRQLRSFQRAIRRSVLLGQAKSFGNVLFV